jgi:predicted PurR-regulated permease PerM
VYGPASWFTYAFRLALGALCAYAVIGVAVAAEHVLVLLLLAVFLAVSLEPVVELLTDRGLHRQLAVAVVTAGLLALVAGFAWIVVPPVVTEINALIDGVPHVLAEIRDRSTWLGRLEQHYRLEERAQGWVSSQRLGSEAVTGLVGAGRIVFGAVTSVLATTALTLYFLVGMARIKAFAYRLVPASRRPRVVALSEEISTQVGRYMLGKIVTSAIAGLATYAWAAPWGIPFAAALGALVGVLDMIPVVGSTVGGFIVTLVALSVSVPVAVATLGFYVFFRLAEDYVLTPKAMRYSVDVHPVVTVVAVLVGGTVLGIVGALVAIPVAVAVRMTVAETVIPRLNEL